MITIIIYGEKSNSQISKLIIDILKKYYNVFYYNCDKIWFYNSLKNENINIVETQCLKNIICENAVLILKNKANINKVKNISENVKVIINSEKVKNISAFAKKLKYVYTCGFSSKDYITFSSIEDHKFIISLQRSVKNTNHNICEPFDISVDIENEIDNYSLLSVAMTLIVLGIVDENTPQIII